jgi:hypothetical protein
VYSSTALKTETVATCDTRTCRIGTRTPASIVRSRCVRFDGVPDAVGGPEKNEVVLDAATHNVGRHRS